MATSRHRCSEALPAVAQAIAGSVITLRRPGKGRQKLHTAASSRERWSRRAALPPVSSFPGQAARLNLDRSLPITRSDVDRHCAATRLHDHAGPDNPSSLVGSSTALTGGVAAPSDGTGSTAGAASTAAPSAFAAALADASSQLSTPGLGSSVPVAGSGAPGVGSQIVAVAASQVGQAEQPPGSNESPAIAQYRTATAGAGAGEPWCAYFASWAARQAGEPIGDQGQGLGSVSAIWSWAQSSGRAVQNGPGVTPKPGDLIVFGASTSGSSRGVLPDGRIQTIEGNYDNQVSQNTRSPTEATGYVSMS